MERLAEAAEAGDRAAAEAHAATEAVSAELAAFDLPPDADVARRSPGAGRMASQRQARHRAARQQQDAGQGDSPSGRRVPDKR